jgi:hypothetical protein
MDDGHLIGAIDSKFKQIHISYLFLGEKLINYSGIEITASLWASSANTVGKVSSHKLKPLD